MCSPTVNESTVALTSVPLIIWMVSLADPLLLPGQSTAMVIVPPGLVGVTTALQLPSLLSINVLAPTVTGYNISPEIVMFSSSS